MTAETLPNLAPAERARRVADLMWAAEPASKSLGIVLDDVGPGRAEMSLTVEPRHAN